MSEHAEGLAENFWVGCLLIETQTQTQKAGANQLAGRLAWKRERNCFCHFWADSANDYPPFMTKFRGLTIWVILSLVPGFLESVPSEGPTIRASPCLGTFVPFLCRISASRPNTRKDAGSTLTYSSNGLSEENGCHTVCRTALILRGMRGGDSQDERYILSFHNKETRSPAKTTLKLVCTNTLHLEQLSCG
jgi:hypothetical protein